MGMNILYAVIIALFRQALAQQEQVTAFWLNLLLLY